MTFRREQRQMRDRRTELLEIPGIGGRATKRLLQHFGSLQAAEENRFHGLRFGNYPFARRMPILPAFSPSGVPSWKTYLRSGAE